MLVYALKKLTNREKQIMEMRFGLVNGKEMTQKKWQRQDGDFPVIYIATRKK